MHRWLLPLSIGVFALLSLLTIGSVRDDLLARQLIFFLLGGGLYFAVSRISFTRWLDLRWLAYIGVIVLLILPLVLGHSSRNTSRWIELGIFRLQPSQLAIPLVGLSSVWLLSKRTNLKQVLLFLLSLVPPAALIFISPDLGTTVVFLVALMSILWFAGTSLKQLAVLAAIAVSIVLLSWMFILKPYQRERMMVFLAGTQAESQQHYNATQALIAVGGGKLTGSGWGKGTQSHLQFLPEKQTDFIFSSYSEEFGFVGTTLVLLLVLMVAIHLYRAARNTSEKTAALYLILAANTICMQAMINIGMNIGLLPITGVTLPLVSYGGSSILATCLMLGICDAIIRGQNISTPRVIS